MDGFEVTLMPTRVELMTFQCSLEELYRQDKWQPIALIYLRDRLAFTQSHPLGTALPGRSPGAHLAAAPGHPFLIFSSKPGSVCTWLMDLGLGHGFFFSKKENEDFLQLEGLTWPHKHRKFPHSKQPEPTMAWHGKSWGTKRRQQQGKAMKWTWYFKGLSEEK